MLDLLLRHYRGAFDRIYLYSRSASLDKGWDPLRKYIEEVQHVKKSHASLMSLTAKRCKIKWICK